MFTHVVTNFSLQSYNYFFTYASARAIFYGKKYIFTPKHVILHFKLGSLSIFSYLCPVFYDRQKNRHRIIIRFADIAMCDGHYQLYSR